MFSFNQTGSLLSQLTYLYGKKFLQIFNIMSLKEELENQYFCYQVICASSPIAEFLVYLKHQPFRSARVSVDKEGVYNITIKSTMYDLMMTA